MVDFKELDRHIENCESFVKDLKEKYNGKTGSRFFSSYGWMTDHLQQGTKNHILPLKQHLIRLGDEYDETKQGVKYVNAGKALIHINKTLELLEDLAKAYRHQEPIDAIMVKVETHIPSLLQEIDHARKRINLIRGFSGLVQEL